MVSIGRGSTAVGRVPQVAAAGTFGELGGGGGGNWYGVDRGWARPPGGSSWCIRLVNLAAASVNLLGVDHGWTRPPCMV